MAESDIYMFLESSKGGVIKGESLDATHPNELELASFQVGVSNTSKAAGDGDWKPDFSDVTATLEVSRATPLLMKAASDGTTFKRITVSFRKGGAKRTGEANGDYLQYRFYNAVITSYTISQSEKPIDSLSFNYQCYEVMYIQQSQTGALDEKFHKGWHVGKNMEFSDFTLPYKGGGAK